MKNAYKITWLMLLLLAACGKKEVAKEEVLRPVKYTVVDASKAENTRTFTGTAQASNEIELSFRQTGVIQVINVKKGQRVRQGDLIAQLDNLEDQLTYERYLTQVSSTESSMNTARAELDRVKSLYEKGSAPLKDYQNAKNRYQNALSQFEAAQRNLEIQRSQLNYGLIYAPSDGIIANTSGKVNERVPTGHVFAILNAGDQKKVALELPENVINEVTVGMQADIRFSSLPDANFSGTVIEVSPITSTDAATYPVDIEIDNPTEQIRPGMAASVTFNFATSSSDSGTMIVAPIKAVGEDGKGNYVFLIETEDKRTGVARKRQVEVGAVTTNGFEIEKGLEPGQIIATAGLQTLLDGQKVKLN